MQTDEQITYTALVFQDGKLLPVSFHMKLYIISGIKLSLYPVSVLLHEPFLQRKVVIWLRKNHFPIEQGF